MTRTRLFHAFVLVMSAALALLLTSCGGGGTSEGGGPTKITVWHGFEDTEGDAFKALVDQYNKEHPDVQVTRARTPRTTWCCRRC